MLGPTKSKELPIRKIELDSLRDSVEEVNATTADQQSSLVPNPEDYYAACRKQHTPSSGIRRMNSSPISRYMVSSRIVQKINSEDSGDKFYDGERGGREDSVDRLDRGSRGDREVIRDSGPRRRDLGSGSLDDEGDEDWDQGEIDFGVQVSREPPHVSTYQPAEVSMEALRGFGPTFASGLWGMSEIVEKRLARIEAKRDNVAEWVEFRAKQMLVGERLSCRPRSWKSAKNRAEQLLAAARGQQHNNSATATTSAPSSWGTTHDGENNTTGGDVNKQQHVFTDEQKDDLVRKLVGGRYDVTGIESANHIDSEKNELIEQVLRRYAARNGTYFLEDGEALVKKAMMLVRPKARRDVDGQEVSAKGFFLKKNTISKRIEQGGLHIHRFHFKV